MSFITPVATDANGNPKGTGSTQDLGKDDFLELLVTKLQYQDPMNPMEDEAFIAQLAQFSSLEQMNNIADAINQSNQWDFLQMQSLNNTMASGLIGKEVKATYSSLYIDETNTPKISYSLTRDAQEVTFTIRDESGAVVRTLTADDIEEGTNTIEWDGTNTQGNRVEAGYYSVEVSADDADGKSFTPSLSLIGIVDSVIYRDGGAYLTIDGTEVALGEIESISSPDSGGETDDEG